MKVSHLLSGSLGLHKGILKLDDNIYNISLLYYVNDPISLNSFQAPHMTRYTAFHSHSQDDLKLDDSVFPETDRRVSGGCEGGIIGQVEEDGMGEWGTIS